MILFPFLDTSVVERLVLKFPFFVFRILLTYVDCRNAIIAGKNLTPLDTRRVRHPAGLKTRQQDEKNPISGYA